MKNTALGPGILLLFSMVLPGCTNDAGTEGTQYGTPPRACEFAQPYPYPSGSTYVGVHGNRENSDRIYCSGPSMVSRGWATLEGTLTQQPVSFTADGTAVLVTIARTEGCNLYAIETETGETRWCSDDFSMGVAGSMVEVDRDGFLYVADGDTEESFMYSLFPEDGSIRWRTSLEGLYGGDDGAAYHIPVGIHFTASGEIVTVTNDGVVVLIDRGDGRILDTWSIREELGFVPVPAAEIDMEPLIRAYEAYDAGRPHPLGWLVERIVAVLGPMDPETVEAGLAMALGASGGFSDNTIGVSGSNQVFIIGGGPPLSSRTHSETVGGAVTVVEVGDFDGDPEPDLRLSWYLETYGGSATSPAISRDGSRMVVAEGVDADLEYNNIVYTDVEACNGNTDADPRPEVCEPLWRYHLSGEATMLGSMAMDEDGVVYAWEAAGSEETVDLFKLSDSVTGEGLHVPEMIWGVSFPHDSENRRTQWTSSATVMNDMVIGTLSHLGDTSLQGLGLPLPLFTDLHHELLAVDRFTGEVLWRVPADDILMNSVVPGPDGALYLPYIGLFDLIACPPWSEALGACTWGEDGEISFQGGLVRFDPVP